MADPTPPQPENAATYHFDESTVPGPLHPSSGPESGVNPPYVYGSWPFNASPHRILPQNMQGLRPNLYPLPTGPGSFLPMYYRTNIFESLQPNSSPPLWDLTPSPQGFTTQVLRSTAAIDSAGSFPPSLPMGLGLLPGAHATPLEAFKTGPVGPIPAHPGATLAVENGATIAPAKSQLHLDYGLPRRADSHVVPPHFSSLNSIPIVHVAPQHFELDFKSSTWQNRPARVYMRLASDDVDLSLFEEDATSRFLVLSERASPHRVQLKLPSGKPMTAFYYQESRPFFELQIWHRAGWFHAGQPEPALLLDAHSYLISHQQFEINLVRVNSTRSGPYFTIHCSKGFKVQDLYLVCLFRTGGQLFVSDATPFPSAETRKVRMRGSPSSPTESRDSPLASPPHPSPSFPGSPWGELASLLHLTPAARSPEHLSATILAKTSASPAAAAPKLDSFATWVSLNRRNLRPERMLDLFVAPMVSLPWFFPLLSHSEVAQQFLNAFQSPSNIRRLSADAGSTNGATTSLGADHGAGDTGSATAQNPTSTTNASGRFIVYLADESQPKLTVDAKFTDNSGRQRAFSALLECEMGAPSLHAQNPRFFINSPAYKAATTSTSISGTVSLFQACTGWEPITPSR